MCWTLPLKRTDVRNSNAWDLFCELRDYGLDVAVDDPVADAAAVRAEYGIELST